MTIVQGDLCDQACLERALGEYEVKTVIHLAAQTIVGIANRNPTPRSKQTSAEPGSSWKLPSQSHGPSDCDGFFDKAYGDCDVLPYREDTPLAGKHPYDVSKSCSDLIAQTYAHTYQLPVCITRCGNFYGGGDLNWNRIVPGTIRSVFRGQAPVIRSDGSYIRDYFYVEDGGRRLHASGRTDGEEAGDQWRSVQSLHRNTGHRPAAGRKNPVCDGQFSETVVLGEAKNEIKHQYLDAGKAARLLGWRPQFTLEEGLSRTIAWYMTQLREDAASPNVESASSDQPPDFSTSPPSCLFSSCSDSVHIRHSSVSVRLTPGYRGRSS